MRNKITIFILLSTAFLLTYLRSIENKVIPVNEVFPTGLNGVEIVSHITRKKTVPFLDIVKEKQIIITADTIV